MITNLLIITILIIGAICFDPIVRSYLPLFVYRMYAKKSKRDAAMMVEKIKVKINEVAAKQGLEFKKISFSSEPYYNMSVNREKQRLLLSRLYYMAILRNDALGQNSLFAVIGHELVHFKFDGLIVAKTDRKIGKQYYKIIRKIKEVRADILGYENSGLFDRKTYIDGIIYMLYEHTDNLGYKVLTFLSFINYHPKKEDRRKYLNNFTEFNRDVIDMVYNDYATDKIRECVSKESLYTRFEV